MNDVFNKDGEIFIFDAPDNWHNDLAALLPSGSLRHEPTPQTRARDIPTMVAVVTISLAALRALSVWIARQTQSQETEIAVEVRNPDGTSKIMLFRSRNNSAQSDAEVLKQLAAACNVNSTDVLGKDAKGLPPEDEL